MRFLLILALHAAVLYALNEGSSSTASLQDETSGAPEAMQSSTLESNLSEEAENTEEESLEAEVEDDTALTTPSSGEEVEEEDDEELDAGDEGEEVLVATTSSSVDDETSTEADATEATTEISTEASTPLFSSTMLMDVSTATSSTSTTTSSPPPEGSSSSSASTTSPAESDGTSLSTSTMPSTSTVPATTTSRSRRCEDTINVRTGKSDCPRLVDLCRQASYIKLMLRQCPKTCGFCETRGTDAEETGEDTSCKDLPNPRTGRIDCPNRRALCRHSLYQSLMRRQCARTCGFCMARLVRVKTRSLKSCADSIPSAVCMARKHFCQHDDIRFRRQMESQCSLTCRMCL